MERIGVLRNRAVYKGDTLLRIDTQEEFVVDSCIIPRVFSTHSAGAFKDTAGRTHSPSMVTFPGDTSSGIVAVHLVEVCNALSKYSCRTKPYTVSKKGRLCFNHGPGLFQGMKAERLGQVSMIKSVSGSVFFCLYLKEGDPDSAEKVVHLLKAAARYTNRLVCKTFGWRTV